MITMVPRDKKVCSLSKAINLNKFWQNDLVNYYLIAVRAKGFVNRKINYQKTFKWQQILVHAPRSIWSNSEGRKK